VCYYNFDTKMPALDANAIAQKKGPSKLYSFQLLRKRPTLWRMDVFPLLPSVAAIWFNFGAKIFDREELVPVLCLMLAVTVHSLLFFINFWNADINVLFCYNQLGDNVEIS
jgi:hypothetical protein